MDLEAKRNKGETIELVFHAEQGKGTAWSGRIEQAFQEFFLAKAHEEGKGMVNDRIRFLNKEYDEGDIMIEEAVDIGNGRANAFEASNGISIWWESFYRKKSEDTNGSE